MHASTATKQTHLATAHLCGWSSAVVYKRREPAVISKVNTFKHKGVYAYLFEELHRSVFNPK